MNMVSNDLILVACSREKPQIACDVAEFREDGVSSTDAVTQFQLRIVDEGESFPAFDTIEALLGDGVSSGQFEISACQARPVSDFTTLSTHAAGTTIPAWWRERPPVVSEALKIFRMRDAVVLPAYGIVISRNGGIMKSSYAEPRYLLGEPQALPRDLVEKIQAACCRTGPDAIQEIAAAAVVMPWGGNTNYGHFILDALPRPENQCGEECWAAHVPVFPPLNSWHRDHLHLVGQDDPLILTDEIYRVRDVIWTTAIDHFLETPTELLRDLSEFQIAKLAGKDSTYGERLWISRAGDKKRGFSREKQLEAALADLGFSILRPEQLSVDQQIQAFRGARLVAGFTGAGLSNIIYCPPGATVVEVLPKFMQEVWLRNVAAMTGINWHPYFCKSRSPKTAVVYGGVVRRDIGIRPSLDIDDFVDFMTDILNRKKLHQNG